MNFKRELHQRCRLLISWLAIIAMITGAVLINRIASAQQGRQASITLGNCDAAYCYTHNNLWTIDKEGVGNTPDGKGTVTWTVTATKSDGGTTFTVHGGLSITNTGSAPATIGNIVVNLQKPNSPKKGSNASHVSIAADVANATNGDAATSAKIVATSSAENAATNAAWGTGNYAVSGAQGTFTETLGKSGALEFTDASNNTAFSLVPQPLIPVGATVSLLYHASFDPSVLPPSGTQLRVETLVTFGNAGLRGGSGSTASNIDINGDGMVKTDEANVRTVPCRKDLPAVPAAPTECNSSVTVTDTGATVNGTVTASNPMGFDQFGTISDSASWTVSVDVDSGADGGEVCNKASLKGAACGGSLSVIVQYDTGLPAVDPNTGTQIGWWATYECAAAADDNDESCVDVAPPSGGGGCHTTFCLNDFCTYTHGGYANGNGVPNQLITANWAAIVSPVTIGINDGGGPKHNATWTILTTFQTWVGGGGTSGALSGDTFDATSTGGGALAKQTATLDVNIKLGGGFGNLIYHNAGDSLDGKTVSQILAAANKALGEGSGSLPSSYTFGSLNTLITNLNEAFDNCTPSSWAQTHLSRP